MDTFDWDDKGKKTVSAEWFHRAQERLAPYVRNFWDSRAPHTANIEYEVVEIPARATKFVKEK